MQSYSLITISEGRPLSKYPISELDSEAVERLVRTAPKDANWVEIKATQKAMDIYNYGALEEEMATIDSMLRILDEWEKE